MDWKIWSFIKFGQLLVLLASFLGCTQENGATFVPKNEITAFDAPPKWAKNVVWYEIGVERFRNGDTSNDPTAESIEGSYPGFVPEGWKVTPWIQDWYKEDDYFKSFYNRNDDSGYPIDKFVNKVQARRYGGDLQGVLDKIPYLDSLGITAVYFRPLNDAPSLHKYDARNWRHIDVNFGPDPEGDRRLIASETADDPMTWVMTQADKMFVAVIDELHKKGIKVIIDYSWNHTGSEFWAWQDVLEKQTESEFKDWYWIENFDDSTTPESEFKYHGWVGVATLPELRETVKQDASVILSSFEGDIYSAGAKKHIFNVTKRWLDPNGDGNTEDGVDGYRLDVAAEMPLGFWRDYRAHVRSINPDAYLIGEIWWEQFPDKLLDPEPFLRGDIFDAVMNYRWYRSARHFFNESPTKITAANLKDSLRLFRSNIKDSNNYAMMNYTGGFDTPRILTSLFNKNKYKYQAKAHEKPEYKIYKPDAATYQTLKLLLVQQFTYVGAPHIYAGDEMGMWGADDPSSRKPLIWNDYQFEDETHHPLGLERPVDEVKFNEELFAFYGQLIGLRKHNPVLAHGNIEDLQINAHPELLAYRRFDNKEEIVVVFNTSSEIQNIELPVTGKQSYKSLLDTVQIENSANKIRVELPPRSAAVLKMENK